MPLTAEEKNTIAQGGVLIGTEAIGAAAGLSAAGIGVLGLVALPLLLGLTAQFSRVRFPRISPEDLVRSVRLNLLLKAQGIEPRQTTDPFFGDIVISRASQAPFLEELLETRARVRIFEAIDNAPILLRRRAIIEGLAETAEERGFASAVDPALRGGVFRPTAEAPLQFIPGEFL